MATKSKSKNQEQDDENRVTQEDITKALEELKDDNTFTEEEIAHLRNITKSEDGDEEEEEEEEEGTESEEDDDSTEEDSNEDDEDDDVEKSDDNDEDDEDEDEDEDEGSTNAKVEDDDDDEEESKSKKKAKSVAKAKKPMKKAKKDDDNDEDDSYFSPSKEKGMYRKVRKGADGKEEFADDKTYKKNKTEKGSYAFEAVEPSKKNKKNIAKSTTLVDLIKSKDVQEILKGNPDLKKSIDLALENSTKELDIIKSELDEERKNSAESAVNAKLIKSFFEEVVSLKKQLKEMGETPIRKSANAKAIKRDFGGEDEEDIQKADGKNVLSVSQHRTQVLNLMESLAFKKSDSGEQIMDSDLSKAIFDFEIGAGIKPNVVQRIQKESGIKLVQ